MPCLKFSGSHYCRPFMDNSSTSGTALNMTDYREITELPGQIQSGGLQNLLSPLSSLAGSI
jgi:hypothetical protein